ncbi:WD40 repeat domain-containing protein, partial [bacterium]|nr:WD40 repeat domain-containing protein [bacterium]
FVTAIAWSPDGRRLAATGRNGYVRVFETTRGTLSGEAKCDWSWAFSLAWSPDGRELASGNHEGVVQVWDASNLSPLRMLQDHRGTVNWAIAVAWSPDGKRVASSLKAGKVVLQNANGEGQEVALECSRAPTSAAAWSPDSKRLATGADDGKIRLFDGASGRKLDELTAPGSVGSISWSPDGRFFAAGCGEHSVLLWDASKLGAAPLLVGKHTRGVSSVAFSPDGKLIASGSPDRTVKLWSFESRAEVASLRMPGVVSAVAFKPASAGGRPWLACAIDETLGRVLLYPLDELLGGKSPESVLAETERETGLTIKGASLDPVIKDQ